MGDDFELLDPGNAQLFLKRFTGGVRRRGEAWFHGGSVQELVPEEPGAVYSASVRAQGLYQVRLSYDAGEGWSGSCSCPARFDCEHTCATMCALLAEHRTAVVRSLSAGLRSSVSVLRNPQKGPAAYEPGDMSRRLVAALGRPFTSQEKKFLGRLQAVFWRCRQVGHITQWDFAELGLPLAQAGYGWTTLEIWPAPPANEHEFWLYVANAVQEHGGAIPEFMKPVTDLQPIRERLDHWRRSREIEKWKQTLGQLHLQPGPSGLTQGEFDLRLLIAPDAARLQFRPAGADSFATPKQAQFNRLRQAYNQGELQLVPGADLLWHFLTHDPYQGTLMKVRYYDASDAILGRILRASQLHSRVVNELGLPLARPAEPLRWELTPAATEDDDYRLCLAQADGTRVPPFYCVIPGHPTLYLTPDAVFKGPPALDNVLDSETEVRIPAPAIESVPGVAFLQSLRVELPPRVRERIRSLPLQVAIHCELRRLYPASPAEDCVVRVQAQAPDGYQQTFDGQQWLDATPRRALKGNLQEALITVYERAPLELVPALLAPLNLKRDPYDTRLAARVTRKFPEEFAAWLKTVPPHVIVELEGELASFISAEVAGRVRLEVTEAEIDWFDLQVVVNVSDTTLTQEEIKLLLNAKGRYVRLKGKGWRRLQFDLSPDEDERLARLGLNPRELSAEPQRLHALQLADEAAKKFLPAQQVEQIQRRALELKARVTPNLPAGVTAQLRPYQLEGFHFLAYLTANRFGGILADDMGLGKTLQTLAWLLWLREQTQPGQPEAYPPTDSALAPPPALVVCPKSVMDNWQAESARFTPGLRVKVWPAGELSTFTARLAEADLHVLNYTQLRSLGEPLASIPWLAVILDEGQYIKNPNSQTAQVARALRARHRLVLSGTPIENRLLDLWSLMAFAMPGLLGSRPQFARLYDAKDDPFARRRLASRVRPFLVRRTKSQVAKDLPDRIEEDLFCEIEGEQQTLYRAELKRAQQLLLAVKTQKELAEQQFHFLVSLLRLRQICCHPALVNPDSRAASAKTDALVELLEPVMEEGQKVLVFSQFVTMLDLLQPVLEEHNWPLFYLAGGTENRGELIRQFQSTEGPAVFLISLKAGGFGLNLTAASYVVLFDPWWNPAVENQAIDRTHRIGQANKVIAYRLLIKDSIEEKIRQLQKKKAALAEDVLGEERFAQSLTLEDLRFLFAD